MYEAEDKLFFDELYQQWSKTTGAKDTYWMPEEVSSGPDVLWEVYAVEQVTDEKLFIATFNSEEDADFVAGLHGAIPDLIRRLHEAIDEAERKDEANDIAQGALAEAYLESNQLHAQIEGLEEEIESLKEYKWMYEELQ